MIGKCRFRLGNEGMYHQCRVWTSSCNWACPEPDKCKPWHVRGVLQQRVGRSAVAPGQECYQIAGTPCTETYHACVVGCRDLIQSTVFRQDRGRVPDTAVALLRPAPAKALLAGRSGLVPAPVPMPRSESVLPRLHRGCNPESGASRSSGWSGEGWTATWTKCSARSHARRYQAEHPPDSLL